MQQTFLSFRWDFRICGLRRISWLISERVSHKFHESNITYSRILWFQSLLFCCSRANDLSRRQTKSLEYHLGRTITIKLNTRSPVFHQLSGAPSCLEYTERNNHFTCQVMWSGFGPGAEHDAKSSQCWCKNSEANIPFTTNVFRVTVWAYPYIHIQCGIYLCDILITTYAYTSATAINFGTHYYHICLTIFTKGLNFRPNPIRINLTCRSTYHYFGTQWKAKARK